MSGMEMGTQGRGKNTGGESKRPGLKAMKAGTLALASAAALLSATQAHATTYTFVQLAPLSGATTSQAAAINTAGAVVGISYKTPTSDIATVWTGGAPTPLGKAKSIATAINDSGQVAGYVIDKAGDANATVVFKGKSVDLLPLDETLDTSYAFGVNASGEVVGTSLLETPQGAAQRAVAWKGTSPTDLGTLGGESSAAYAINSIGVVVGNSLLSDNATTHAAYWAGGPAVDLGALPGASASYATAINASSVAVGQSITGSVSHAVKWTSGTIADLGVLGGSYTSSSAAGINDGGVVVGQSTSARKNVLAHATMWTTANAIVDLNTLLDAADVSAGWVLETASAISSKGVIVGNAYNKTTGVTIAYEFVPGS